MAFLLTTVGLMAQVAFRDLDVTILRDPAPGYYFIAPNSMDSFSVMDNAGKNMYKTRVGQHANVMTFGGKWISHFTADRGLPVFLRRDVNRAIIDTMRVTAPYQTDFHEGRIVSDTSYLILGIEVVKMDMSQVVPGGHPNADVWVNIVQERTFDGRTLFTWRSLDHIPVTDAADQLDLTTALVDYIHINSITKDSDGNILISCRHLDEIVKINRTTGAIMWRLGGSRSKNNDFRFLNDTTNGFFGFSHQHAASRTSAGTILLFDNGNLKPEPQRSRAVEYKLDEVNMTAERVWQFVPSPDIYGPTMGSAQELENGNILIGYGSGSNKIVAHEVSRDGVIEVEISNPTLNGFTSYRVYKDAFLMTGVYRKLTATGTQTFSKADSTTHVSMNITRLDSATSIVVERHAYAAHSISFSSDSACGVLPTRWVIRVKHPVRIAGTTTFDLGTIPGVEYPDQISLFRRTTDGKGAFTKVDATYSASTKRLTIDNITNGEYIIAYPYCLSPQLIKPVNGETEVSASSPQLVWSEAVGTGEYQVEVASDQSFTTVVHRFSTRSLDTTLQSAPLFTTYYWRARSKRQSGFGPWSAVSVFTTQLGVPSLLTPKVVSDTVAILNSHVFRWNAATGAARYRVVLRRVGLGQIAIDTAVSGLSITFGSALLANTPYTWTVQAVNGTIVGRPSPSEYFITGLQAPKPEAPEFDAADVPFESAQFSWLPVSGALRYVVTVRRAADSVVVAADSTTLSFLVMKLLPGGARLAWTVHAVNKYGAGEPSIPQPFTTLSSVRLNAPVTIGPKRVSAVDTTGVLFSWTSVPDAEFYDLQITSRPNFSRPDIEVFRVTESQWTAPSLKPGAVYGWRVIGYATGVGGRWSDTASFTTKAQDGQALTPIVPMSGSEGISTSGVFLFSTSGEYKSYRVVVDIDPEFSAPLLDLPTTIGTSSYSGLQPQTWYFWKVIGELWAGGTNEGSAARFKTGGTTSVEDADLHGVTPVLVYLTSSELRVVTEKDTPTVTNVQLFDVRGMGLGVTLTPTGEGGYHIQPRISNGVYLVKLEFANGTMWTTLLISSFQ